MITGQNWMIFSVAAFLIALTPGPNMAFIASRTLEQGRGAGLVSLAGVQVGFLVHIVLAITGLAAVLAAVPHLFEIIRWAGAGYMAYLALKAVLPQRSHRAQPGARGQSGWVNLFTTGLATCVFRC